MNKIFSLIVVIMLVVCAFVAPCCLADTGSEYTVKFYTSDTDFSSQTVSEGFFVTAPSVPLKQGYSFKGWTLDNTIAIPAIISITNYKVYSDVNFYAVFVPVEYKVTFVYYNSVGIEVSTSKSVAYKQFVELPLISDNVNGSLFVAWSSDNGQSTTDPILGVVLFTAQYNIAFYSVTYYDKDGIAIDSVSNSGLESVSTYTAPVVDGYNFAGWSLTPDGKPIDKDYRINGSTSLYAVYNLNFGAWYMNLDLGWQIALPLIAIFLVCLIIAIIKRIIFGRKRY
ncbi:MAG: InlB B-repeat-containing protein [Clostridia bacterium]